MVSYYDNGLSGFHLLLRIVQLKCDYCDEFSDSSEISL